MMALISTVACINVLDSHARNKILGVPYLNGTQCCCHEIVCGHQVMITHHQQLITCYHNSGVKNKECMLTLDIEIVKPLALKEFLKCFSVSKNENVIISKTFVT